MTPSNVQPWSVLTEAAFPPGNGEMVELALLLPDRQLQELRAQRAVAVVVAPADRDPALVGDPADQLADGTDP